MDCFDNIIGFTQTDCSCFTGEFADGNNTSNSGLYMDGLPESSHILPAVQNTADCGKKMGDLFDFARKAAISSFNEKLYIELGTRFTSRYPAFSGMIGQDSFKGPYETSSSFIGSAYEMRPYKGGILKVRKIRVGINQTTSVTVSVYKAYVINGTYQIQGAAIETYAVDAVANKLTEKVLDTPLELPLSDESSHVVNYLFLIDRSAGFLPLDMKASCGCQNQNIVDRWLLQGGIEGTSTDTLQFNNRKTGSTAPVFVVIDADLQCVDTGLICENYASNRYVREAINYAILYEAAANLLDGVLRSDAINRYTLTKREQMATDSAILHNKFKSRIPWIGENINPGNNSCFICSPNNEYGIYKTNIRL